MGYPDTAWGMDLQVLKALQGRFVLVQFDINILILNLSFAESTERETYRINRSSIGDMQ